jgi:hypothetical protein
MTVNDGKLMNVVLQDEKSNGFKKKEKVLKCSYLTRSFIRSRVLQEQVLWFVTLTHQCPGRMACVLFQLVQNALAPFACVM